MHLEHSSLLCQTFRKLGLSLAADGSEDDELSVKDIPGITVGDWKLSTGQEDKQEVEEPDTTDNSEEVQKDDETEGVIEVREYVLSAEREDSGQSPPPPSPQRKSFQIRTSYKPPPHTK